MGSHRRLRLRSRLGRSRTEVDGPMCGLHLTPVLAQPDLIDSVGRVVADPSPPNPGVNASPLGVTSRWWQIGASFIEVNGLTVQPRSGHPISVVSTQQHWFNPCRVSLGGYIHPP